MYWYYKLFFVAIIGLILYGIFSIAGLKFPEIFKSKTEEVQKNPQDPGTVNSGQNAGKGTEVGGTVVKPRNPSSTYNLTPAQNAVLLEARQLYTKDQKLDDAYEKAVSLLESRKVPEFSKGWFKVADFISEINTKLIFSSAPSDRKENHRVVSGDSLSKIAKGHTTITGLQIGNDIPLDSQTIHPNQVIRFFPGDWTIEISKSYYTLVLYHKGRFFKYYKVGIGKQDRTPEGKFKIYGKVTDPIWYQKGGVRIQPGDPRNVLGSRWMELKPIEGTQIIGDGYGIHGTTQPDSIGTPASQGCIRMRNEQIEELYDIIPDTKVVVTIRK